MVVVPKSRSMIFASNKDQPPFLGDMPPSIDLPVDNPDGVVRAMGLGCYERAPNGENSRFYSQGAGTVKGNIGNAGGTGKAIRIKGDGFGY